MIRANILAMITLLFLSLPAPDSGECQQSYKPFSLEQYDQKQYRISQQDIKQGELLLRIIQAKKLSRNTESPRNCRAWFDVIKTKESIFQKYYDDINPVGFSFGIFVPNIQPPSPYSVIVKNGDYDGRLFLVRQDGKVYDLMGGFYFITKDKRYLFSEYASDAPGLVVFDLTSGLTVFSSDKIPYIHQWYIKGDEYFFTESEWIPANLGKPTEKAGVAHFYDFKAHQIISKYMISADARVAKVLAHDFDPREYGDCVAEESTVIEKDGRKTPGR